MLERLLSPPAESLQRSKINIGECAERPNVGGRHQIGESACRGAQCLYVNGGAELGARVTRMGHGEACSPIAARVEDVSHGYPQPDSRARSEKTDEETGHCYLLSLRAQHFPRTGSRSALIARRSCCRERMPQLPARLPPAASFAGPDSQIERRASTRRLIPTASAGGGSPPEALARARARTEPRRM